MTGFIEGSYMVIIWNNAVSVLMFLDAGCKDIVCVCVSCGLGRMELSHFQPLRSQDGTYMYGI